MKHIIILLTYCLSSLYFPTLQTDSIAGKWMFSEVLNENLDENTLTYLKANVIDKWVFVFNTDGTFESNMKDQNAKGTWTLNAENNTISVFIFNGDKQEFKILKSTKDELALNLGLGRFLLKRKE